MQTRRDFGKLALASVPAILWGKPNSKIRGVQIGAITYSFRADVKKSDLVATMSRIGLSEVELMSGDAEAIAGIPTAPAGGAPRGGGGGRTGGGRRGAPAEVAMAPNGCAVNTPAGRAAMPPVSAGGGEGGGRRGGGRGAMSPEQEELQKKIRDWRASATDSTWKGVRKQFNDAGIDLQILCFNMNNNMTNEDFDYAFQMARGLGVRAISCSTTVPVAKRVAPFADKYKIVWAGHGHADVYDPEQFAKPETFDLIMSFSKYIGVNLDIGHFTAAGYDPVAYIKQHHAKITNLHLKDRMKPDKCGNSANLPWGQGQTPIKEVLQLMQKEKYSFPANIEFEYQTPAGSNSEAEVVKCYEFARKCLEG